MPYVATWFICSGTHAFWKMLLELKRDVVQMPQQCCGTGLWTIRGLGEKDKIREGRVWGRCGFSRTGPAWQKGVPGPTSLLSVRLDPFCSGTPFSSYAHPILVPLATHLWSTALTATGGPFLVSLTCYPLFLCHCRSLPSPGSTFYRWEFYLFLDLIHPWNFSQLQLWATQRQGTHSQRLETSWSSSWVSQTHRIIWKLSWHQRFQVSYVQDTTTQD